MTITINEPDQIDVTATSESTYNVTATAQASQAVTISLPNQGEKGDKGDPGIFIPVGVDKEIQYNDGGVLGADNELKWDKNQKTLRIGSSSPALFQDNPIVAIGSVDDFLQLVVHNESESATASSDFVAVADNGNDDAFYINMGINSSVYSVEGDASGANDGYVYIDGGNLFIATNTVGKHVIIQSEGEDVTDTVCTIKATGIEMATGKTITNRPEIFYGTGSPPSPTGKADGTLFFKYTP
jgi:hypothetical protein